jgi:hypothetical protein
MSFIAVTSAITAVAYGAPRLGYDALFALFWGRQVYRLELPSVAVAQAPTPHPLATIVGALVAPLGDEAAATAMTVLACVAFATAGYGAWLVGSRLFGSACGALFALLLLTRPGLVTALLFASTDMWFLALVLLAGAQLARRPMDSTGPLIALALAGLLRPEAWALAIIYVVFLALRRAPGRSLLAAGALTLAAPLIWLTLDWIWAGDPLHSLRATRELAVALERPRGLSAAINLGAEYLAALLGEPLLWAGLAGCVIVTALAPECAVLPAVLLLAGTAGFGILAVAGLPLIERYVVLPAAALALAAAAAALGWRVLPRGPTRRAWAGGGTTMLALGALLLPAQVRQLRNLREQAAVQRHSQRTLRAIASQLRGTPAHCVVQVPSFQEAQTLAFFSDIELRRIGTADQLADRPPTANLRMIVSPSRAAPSQTLPQRGSLILAPDTRSTGCWARKTTRAQRRRN